MSILPNSSPTFLKTSRICSRLVTSILIARDLRPILRIASAVAFECTQPCDTATCASMLPCDSAVCWRFGSSSTSTSVMTTSAPKPARVSASCLPSPREAPVTTATRPFKSNIPYPLSSCAGVSENSMVTAETRRSPCQDRFALLVHRAQLELALPRGLGPKRHGVAGQDHACEPYEDAAQAIRATRRLSRDGGGNAHLQHAVRDQAWQTDGPREAVVEVDGVAVARRLGVG